jgi:hypothetical protein
MNTEAIDRFLVRTASSLVHKTAAPAWPADLNGCEAMVARRVAFHGIALLIAGSSAIRAVWPEAPAGAVREQAGVQAFWEQSHRPVIARLLEELAAAGITAIVTKGTALAYSVYDDPALRRRGDTDIYIPGPARKQARKVLRACGFRPAGDTKALQESWVADTAIGFAPAVDIHWRINASSAVSQMLEGALRLDQAIALDRLSARAIGIGPVDNLILIAINRSAHGQFGYHVGDDLLFDTDRLIWALDVHLLASAFGAQEWDALTERVARTGTGPMVEGMLAFAMRVFGTAVPEATIAALRSLPADQGLAAYYGASSHLWRLKRDIAAGADLAEKAQVLRYAVFPSDEFLQARFPDAQAWARPVLHLRRMIEGASKLLSGRI